MNDSAWHSIKPEQVLKKLGTSKRGISDTQASERLKSYGPNEFEEKKKISRIQIFLSQFRSFLVIILIIAAVISAFVGHMIDAVVILIIVILNAVLGYVQEYRAEKAMEALKKMASPKTLVIREGRKKTIESRMLVPGDIVVLEEGSRVPADLRLLDVSELKIDESALTGESVPVGKHLEILKQKTPVSDRKNMAFMGTVVTSGRGLGVVVSTGMRTEMGKIAEMIQVEEEKQTPLQRTLQTFGKHLGIMILAICAVVVAVGVFRGENILTMFITGIALAVAAVPEGLPAVVTITLAAGLQKMAKRNAIVRKLPAVETLGCTTVICSDKTGTLTRGEMVVSRIYSDGRIIDVSGEGYRPEGVFSVSGRKIDPERDKGLNMLLKAGILCNNAELSKKNEWDVIGDPTEGALLVSGAKAMNISNVQEKYPRIKEIPFTSERKMMSVVCRSAEGRQVFSKGAVETILNLCTRIYRNGKIAKITAADRKKIKEANSRMTSGALRVLAFAFKDLRQGEKEEKGLVFLGLQGMIDLPREEVKKDIAICKKAGIKVVMITGDHRDTAVAIARDLEIISETDSNVLTGQELEEISHKELEKIAENVHVYARVNPVQKVKILQALQKRGHVVAMTGDGVNDSPAIKKSDIGIAMGIKGTDVAKEASDMILRDDNFSTIVDAVESGRAIYDNILKFIQYLLSSNLGEVLVVFVAMLIGFTDPTNPLTGFVIPVTAIQLLWINLLTDGLPAVALGLDPPAPGVMERKPRDPKEKILNRNMLTDIIIVGVIICIGTLFIFNINLTEGAVKAQTAAFTMLVMFEMVRVQSVRLKYKAGLFSNMKLIYAMAASIILQLFVIYIPYLQLAFNTTGLSIMDWIEIILVSLTVLVVMWVKEKIHRRGR